MSSSKRYVVDIHAAEVEDLIDSVDEISAKVQTLEKRVVEAEKFYTKKGNLNKPQCVGINKQQQLDASLTAKRKQDLMDKFSAILERIMEHEWSWPFLVPVNADELGLHDYHQVIEKPMDLGTVQAKMKTGSYKNVRDIYADVRLVFKNAIKYNDEKDDVHVMAQSLLKNLEEKWLQLLPKVVEEEKRRVDDEAQARLNMKRGQEVAYASMAKDLSKELSEIDEFLTDLRKMVVQKCRKMSYDDKRRLGTALTRLSPEDLSKALDIVAQDNPQFQAAAQEVDVDIDTLSDYTLWRLKVFVKDALTVKPQAPPAGNKAAKSKRNREPSDASAKTANKRTKRISCM